MINNEMKLKFLVTAETKTQLKVGFNLKLQCHV